MIVWVVTGESGAYSDFDKWVVGVGHNLLMAHLAASCDTNERTKYGVRGKYQQTRSARKPAKIVPGVTTVALGQRESQGYAIYYKAEAFEVKE